MAHIEWKMQARLNGRKKQRQTVTTYVNETERVDALTVKTRR